MESRTRNASRNMITGVISKIVSLILPFVARTVILYALGSAYLGVGTLFTSVLSFLSLAELGFSSAITFAMYKPIAEHDTEKICALLNYYRKLYRIIGCVVLAIGLSIMPIIPLLIKGDLPEELNVYILYLIYLFNSVISYFVAGYRQGLLSAYQRMDITNICNFAITTVAYVIQIAAVLATKNYYVYAFVPILGTVAINISNAVISRRMFPEIGCRGTVDIETKNKIKKKMGGLFGTKLNSIVVNQADTLVISAFLGITVVAEYGNYYYIMNAVCGFIMIIFSSLTASVGNKIASDSLESCYQLFRKISFFNDWIVCVCSVCFVCLYQPFMKLWVGEDLMLSFEFVILFVVYFFIYEIQRTILTFKDAAGLWYEDRYRPYASMSINLIFNILLVQMVGIYGIVISTIIAFVISLPWANGVLFKNLFRMSPMVNIFYILKNAIVTIVSCVAAYMVSIQCSKGILGILEVLIICVIVSNLVFIVFNLNSPTLKSIVLEFRNRVKRRKHG